MTHINETTKHLVDMASLTTVLGTLTAWLPPIAALLSIIWTALRIYEIITGEPIAKEKGSKNVSRSN
jgi:hypothetical protein